MFSFVAYIKILSVFPQGLITKERKYIDSAACPFAKSQGEIEGLGLREGSSLLEVVTFFCKIYNHVLPRE